LCFSSWVFALPFHFLARLAGYVRGYFFRHGFRPGLGRTVAPFGVAMAAGAGGGVFHLQHHYIPLEDGAGLPVAAAVYK
jgi:hypothetical protein